MPYFHVGQRRVLFIHVPKCAGSSITEMLIAHPACTEHGLRREGRLGLDYAVGKCPPQHWHASLLQSTLQLERFDLIFTIIRDPMRRLLSEHAMSLLRSDSAERDFNAWYVIGRQKRLKDPFVWDNHLRPAIEFMLPATLIYALEWGLPRIWRDLCGRLGVASEEVAEKRIRPKQSVATSVDEASSETRMLVAEDYAADCDLHRRVVNSTSNGAVCPLSFFDVGRVVDG